MTAIFAVSLTTVSTVRNASEGADFVDIVQGRAEVELDAFIERRSRRDTDADEREELWKASVAAYNARRR